MMGLEFLLSPLGRWLAGAAAALVILMGIYAKGRIDGAERVQAKWDAAVLAAIERGKAARTDAEREIGDTQPDTNDPFLRKD